MFVDASKGGLEIKIDAAVLYGALQYIELNLVFFSDKRHIDQVEHYCPSVLIKSCAFRSFVVVLFILYFFISNHP